MAANTVAIIQARLGSSRLPMKSLLALVGSPIIDWACERVAAAKLVDRVIVAVPDTPLDAALAMHLRNRGREVVVGSENDVLGRFAKAAKIADAEHVVRVCADNPLIWGEAIDRLISFHMAGDNDYSYNHIPRQNLWPDGLGAEIISRDLLDYMAKKAARESQREHCMNYIWDNRENFKIGTFDPVEDWLKRPDLKLDIDSRDDFLRLALLPLRKDMDAREIIRTIDDAR